MTAAAKKQGRSKGGRPSKFTLEAQEAICEHVARGHTYKNAALLAGISETTFYDWMAKAKAGIHGFPEFSEALTRARAKFLDLVHGTCIDASAKGDWRALMTLAKARFPTAYSEQRINKVEDPIKPDEDEAAAAKPRRSKEELIASLESRGLRVVERDDSGAASGHR